jgi:hypothetical protein
MECRPSQASAGLLKPEIVQGRIHLGLLKRGVTPLGLKLRIGQ